MSPEITHFKAKSSAAFGPVTGLCPGRHRHCLGGKGAPPPPAREALAHHPHVPRPAPPAASRQRVVTLRPAPSGWFSGLPFPCQGYYVGRESPGFAFWIQ